jgi:hypothetical protein
MIRKIKNIGRKFGLLSALLGLLLVGLMTGLGDDQLVLFLQPSVLIGIASVLVLSYATGSRGAIAIVLDKRNFIHVWSCVSFFSVVGALIIGLFVHICFVNEQMNSDVLVFMFVAILLYSIAPIVILSSIVGYAVKYYGEKKNQKKHEFNKK